MAKRPKNKSAAKRHLFELFDRGLRPHDIGKFPGIKQKTLYAYYQLWKHKGNPAGTISIGGSLGKALMECVERATARDEKGHLKYPVPKL